MSNFSSNSHAKKKKKKSRITLIIILLLRRRWEKKWYHVICGNLDPNCVSQNISHKNDWESGRFCKMGAICVLYKSLQLPGEYVLWQLQCVVPSPWGNECRTQKQERWQEHGQLWQDPHPNGKYAVTLSEHCGYLTFI